MVHDEHYGNIYGRVTTCILQGSSGREQNAQLAFQGTNRGAYSENQLVSGHGFMVKVFY